MARLKKVYDEKEFTKRLFKEMEEIVELRYHGSSEECVYFKREFNKLKEDMIEKKNQAYKTECNFSVK